MKHRADGAGTGPTTPDNKPKKKARTTPKKPQKPKGHQGVTMAEPLVVLDSDPETMASHGSGPSGSSASGWVETSHWGMWETTEYPAESTQQCTPASPEPPSQQHDTCEFCGAWDADGLDGSTDPPTCHNCMKLLLDQEEQQRRDTQEFWAKLTEWDYNGVEMPNEYVARCAA